MKRKEAIQILQIYKDELEQRINEADDSDVKDVYQWQVDGFYMAIEALQEAEINCVHCPYYYETEDETGVHSHCGSHGRLIDADALSKKLCETTIFIKDGEVFQRMINDAPTVQADRPHGGWICKGDYAECSECCGSSGTQFDGVEPIPRITAFCPHCGVDMRGGDPE